MTDDVRSLSSKKPVESRPFRTAVLRGLGVVAAPLLTLVILLWIVRTVDFYILEPILDVSRDLVARQLGEIHKQLPDPKPTADQSVFTSGGREFKRLESDQFVPLSVYDTVMRYNAGASPPATGQEALMCCSGGIPRDLRRARGGRHNSGRGTGAAAADGAPVVGQRPGPA